jgi:hypothetical protein
LLRQFVSGLLLGRHRGEKGICRASVLLSRENVTARPGRSRRLG